jgi:hypothetical protein
MFTAKLLNAKIIVCVEDKENRLLKIRADKEMINFVKEKLGVTEQWKT